MARKRRQWSAAETRELYNVLDESARKGSTPFAQLMRTLEQQLLKSLKKGESRLSEKQVKTKLQGLGKMAGVSAEKLVSEWPRHRPQFAAKTHHQQSASPSSRASTLRSRSSGTPQGAEQPSPDSPSPATNDVPAPAADDPISHSRGNSSQSVFRQFRKEDTPLPPEPYESDVTRSILYSAKIPKYDSFDHALTKAWEHSGKCRLYDDDYTIKEVAHYHLGEPVLDTERGVEAFCQGFPIAHLTWSNFTRASLRLGEMLCGMWDRGFVETTLNVLLADPFMNTQIVLRAFAGMAIFVWVFVDQDCLWRYDLPSPIPKPIINGNVLRFCEQYLPLFTESIKREEKLTYLDLVIKPMIPGLARQFAQDLFDVFKSICAPPAPPQQVEPWKHSTTESQEASDGGLSEHRQHYQMEALHQFEQSFLKSLELAFMMRRAENEKYQMEYPKIGASFNHESMTPADKISDGRKLTRGNRVALCLCPTLWQTWGPPQDRKRQCIHKALVMVEGLGRDETSQGYPRVVDLG
ncbi:uncharacterized protein Z520_05058 [Fonsecaea multimorphosa CBS 102226]|uniref:Uncharacterized protein n=1 Tax=Fonsecaea multimorphosa CBS 102226 TaxID=1442371 RepID=A0A0D2K111_9EURO|nr:uncharacterized protein Z520_05058 [Fonsecaea multimorphosa CBS 102226]KIX99482.1 hypothetical protein Z520_05058 [Fonsecaea multimorphosa CBS 102226]OAL25477.1 hypothetical protein AYO22_04796 [Fonsecaea multimorphosa]